jgi:probable phosphoglycerate mutase
MRRRLYLMRHGQVAYFEPDGRPVNPHEVSLTPAGREQAAAAAEALSGISFDRVVTSGLPRTVETAAIVSPGVEAESWRELRELESGRLDAIPEDELEDTFLRAFRGVVPLGSRFLGGETVGDLLDRVLPAVDRLFADPGWDVALAVLHGAVNRAILSHALTGERVFLGGFEQAAGCINVIDAGEDRIVRAVNFTPYDPAHLSGRATTMEQLYEQYVPYRKGARR